MDIEQRKEIISLIAGAYPRFFEKRNELDDPKARMKLWNERLKIWDYRETLKNLNNHIDHSPYEPKISDIKPIIYKRAQDEIVDWEEQAKLVYGDNWKEIQEEIYGE